MNELKAKAYDLLAMIQNLQNQLAQVNQAIIKKGEEETKKGKEDPKPEETKPEEVK